MKSPGVAPGEIAAPYTARAKTIEASTERTSKETSRRRAAEDMVMIDNCHGLISN